jgi:hypothetical protein
MSLPPLSLGLSFLILGACSTFQGAMAPAVPDAPSTHFGASVSDSLLRRAIKRAELVVLATPVALESQHGFLTPQFQLGAKETWYDVKLEVDSVIKGKLRRAKYPDLGGLPAALTPPAPFGRLRQNEIIVQMPVVTSRRSDWAAAAPLIPGERAVFIFRRCYYCLPISGLNTGRGSYYKANPLVAIGPESKLAADVWARVVLLTRSRGR